MLKCKRFRCYFDGCPHSPSVACMCSTPYTYSCSFHIKQHSIINEGDHENFFIDTINLSMTEKVKVITKINKTLGELAGVIRDSIYACSEIINQANQNLKNLIDQVTETRLTMLEARNIILINRPIDSAFVYELMESEEIKFEFDSNGLLNELSRIFTFETINNNFYEKEYVLFAEQSKSVLKAVELNTLKVSTFPKLNNNWYFAGACRISENKYFLTGGFDGITTFKHTSIIDFDKSSEEILPDSTLARHVSGCIYKDNKIYVFGGADRSTLNLAETFDLSTRQWSPLPNLPAPSNSTTTIINEKIVVAGYHLTHAYVFDSNKYIENIRLPETYKIACDKWIITSSKLFECQNLESIQWKENNIICGNIPSIWIANKREKFIYFMNYDLILWRIDTELKIADKIGYRQ